MKVILLQDIKKIGKKDEVINTSDGYARNYLLPKNLAIEATNENLDELKNRQTKIKEQKDLEIEEAQKIADKIKVITLEILVKAGENGKIFGGVTPKEIAEELEKKHKIIIDKKKINLKETIKTLGQMEVEIKITEGVLAKLVVDIKGE